MRQGKSASTKTPASKPIRVSDATHATLTWLASDAGASMQEIVDQAVEEYRRKKLLEATNRAYAALRERPEDWAGMQEERAAWDALNLDGLR